eukprot:4459608-Prymnesium_polylepis.1
MVGGAFRGGGALLSRAILVHVEPRVLAAPRAAAEREPRARLCSRGEQPRAAAAARDVTREECGERGDPTW